MKQNSKPRIWKLTAPENARKKKKRANGGRPGTERRFNLRKVVLIEARTAATSSPRHTTFFFFDKCQPGSTQGDPPEQIASCPPEVPQEEGCSGTCLRLHHHSLATARIYMIRPKHEEQRKNLARQRRLRRWTRKSRRAPLAAAARLQPLYQFIQAGKARAFLPSGYSRMGSCKQRGLEAETVVFGSDALSHAPGPASFLGGTRLKEAGCKVTAAPAANSLHLRDLREHRGFFCYSTHRLRLQTPILESA
ncbi:hypothetical protein HPB48_007433 [Haemaphysalis longicornis]|uniref:Uncharacterized protein n=1 Tax=Haemaphysalis longicornis TaxID=44386 RepID=A0A9J6FVR1_HAELO|nr:hypothetical protein HPB48_007433 [Haemaphysalis longicornis]